MSMTPKPASSSSAGDDRNLVPVDENYLAPTFEDRLRIFWSKNSRSVLVVCVLVLVVILAKGAYEVISAQRAKALAADYAAATTDDQLKTFAEANTGHALGGLARLRLADQAYAAGRFDEARTSYDLSAAALKDTPFVDRARLGAAISLLQSDKTAEGEAAMRALLNDLGAAKTMRAAAAYHLASLAIESNRTDEAGKLLEQLMLIEPDGQWAQRGFALRARLPVSTGADQPVQDTSGTPSVLFK